MEENVLLGFGLIIFAGLSTGIGSALAFFTKQTSKRFLSVSLGFSAGVMIYVSFVEIIAKAQDSLAAVYGDKGGWWVTAGAFFGGILFGAVAGIMVFISLDELLPTAREYGQGHSSIYGLVGGMAVMALSLLLFM